MSAAEQTLVLETLHPEGGRRAGAGSRNPAPEQPFPVPAAEPSLHDLAVAPSFRARPGKFADALRPLRDTLLDQALAHIFPASDPPVAQRHPLRLLAEIRGFPLYLTTTPDSLLKRVLARVQQ